MPPHLPSGLFVTATGTAAGKTFVTRGLARELTRIGRRVAALKPLETGIAPASSPLPAGVSQLAPTPIPDATLLARACDRPELAQAPGFYRATLPVAPYAAALATGEPTPDIASLVSAIATAAIGSTALLVEGAGGLLVPLDRQRTIADLITALDLPMLLVAHNALGVLSHTLTAVEAIDRRGLGLAAIVLVDQGAPGRSLPPDPSTAHNRAILQERLPYPVLAFAACADDDTQLADAARAAGLSEVFQRVAAS
jgi:dethiobiotin synthetase